MIPIAGHPYRLRALIRHLSSQSETIPDGFVQLSHGCSFLLAAMALRSHWSQLTMGSPPVKTAALTEVRTFETESRGVQE